MDRDRQLRSLWVSKVYARPSPLPKVKNALKQGKKSEKQQEKLLVLTCDHIAFLHTQAEDFLRHGHEGSSPGSSSSSFTSTTRGDQAYGFALSLSQIASVSASGASVMLSYIPAATDEPTPLTDTSRGPLGLGVLPAINGLARALLRSGALDAASSGDSGGQAAAAMRLFTDTPEEAEQLAAAILAAVRRLTEALLWLDRGLPVNRSLQIAVVSADLHTGPPSTPGAPRQTNGLAQTEGAPPGRHQIVLARGIAWGSAMTIPAEIMAAASGSTHAVAAALSGLQLHFDLSTPLGPCHLSLPLHQVARLASAGGGLLDATARPDALAAAAIEAAGAGRERTKRGSPASASQFSVQLTCSVAPVGAAAAVKNGALPGHPETTRTKVSAGSLAAWVLLLGTAACVMAVLLPLHGPFVALVAGSAALMASSWGLLQRGGGSASAAQLGMRNLRRNGTSGGLECQISAIRADIVEEGTADDDDRLCETASDEAYGDSGGAFQPNGAGAAPPAATGKKAASIRQHLRRSLTRHRHTAAAGSAPLLDVGAVSFRRAVVSTVSAEGGFSALYSLEEESATLVSGREAAEAEELRSLGARSSVATGDLLERYVAACAGDRVAALQRLRATVEWREANGIDGVLSTPLPFFSAMKGAYLHAVVGCTREGLPVVVEGIGGFKSAIAQLRKQGFTSADMLDEFIFTMEFITRTLNPPSGKFVRIYDLRGIGFTDIADKEAVGVGSQMMQVLERYYPERMARAFVVNTPAFFGALWKMVRPMLDPRTARKITVLSGKRETLAALQEIMEDDVIPAAYGGGGPAGWYDSAEERRAAALAAELNGAECGEGEGEATA